MQFALNHNDALIAASDADRCWRYVCPRCKKRVVLRSGGRNIAHFAHTPGVGTPECELFHPHEDPSIRLLNPKDINAPDFSAWKDLQIYLAEEGRVFQLYVRLPALGNAATESGSIFFRDERGTRTIPLSTLRKPIHLAALPQRDPYVFDRSEKVPEPIWTLFKAGVSGLRDKEVFRLSDGMGRRLERNEPMEMGATYRLVLSANVVPDSFIERFIQPLAKLETWRVYDVAIPKADVISSLSQSEVDYLEHWFGHSLRAQSITVWITAPLPLRYEDDCWIFPLESALEVQTTGVISYAPTIMFPDGAIAKPTEVIKEGCHWRFMAVLAGIYHLRMQNHVAITFRLQSHDALFTPDPIEVSDGDVSIPLFSARAMLSDLRTNAVPRVPTLNLPAAVPWDAVQVNGASLNSNDFASAFANVQQPFAIDAGAYGQLCLPLQSEARLPAPRASELDGVIAWLLTLPNAAGSSDSVVCPPNLGKKVAAFRGRRWSRRYAPHIHWLANMLEDRKV